VRVKFEIDTAYVVAKPYLDRIDALTDVYYQAVDAAGAARKTAYKAAQDAYLAAMDAAYQSKTTSLVNAQETRLGAYAIAHEAYISAATAGETEFNATVAKAKANRDEAEVKRLLDERQTQIIWPAEDALTAAKDAADEAYNETVEQIESTYEAADNAAKGVRAMAYEAADAAYANAIETPQKEAQLAIDAVWSDAADNGVIIREDGRMRFICSLSPVDARGTPRQNSSYWTSKVRVAFSDFAAHYAFRSDTGADFSRYYQELRNNASEN
jgi:G:T-mismatch repair DNA endonuclease (very short patch repair protein)